MLTFCFFLLRVKVENKEKFGRVKVCSDSFFLSSVSICQLSFISHSFIFFLAFNSLGKGKNPSYSPTPCLKIRNMFDSEV